MTAQTSGPQVGESPTGYFVAIPPQSEAAQIDIRKMIADLWRGRYIIFGVALLLALVMGLYAFFIATPIYQARTTITLRVDEAMSGGGGLGGQLGGLASLAGVNVRNGLPGRVEYIARLRSRDMAEKFIRQENLLPVFFSDKYDSAARKWKEAERAPTMDDAVLRFRNVQHIAEDVETGLISVGFDWKDRFLASKWARDFVALTNAELRASALRETQGNLAYLADQARRVQNESLRESIVRLTETNLNRAMLAKAQPDFAFKIIDPPTVPDQDKFISPARPLMVLSGFFAGMLLAMIVVLWRGNKV